MKDDIKTLYVDFDGTLVNTIKKIVDLYNEDFQHYENFHCINWWEIDTWEFEECDCAPQGYINQYFNQPRFFDDLYCMPLAPLTINDLSQYYNIKIVSHGYLPNLKLKEMWIKCKFPFVEFVGVNLKEYSDKSHIDMSDGLFIDDSSKNLITSNAKDKICFGKTYSWNEDWTGKRMNNWAKIRQYLLGIGKEVTKEK
nr:hypothetical protein [uncultured Lachnoclostridium sp.]